MTATPGERPAVVGRALGLAGVLGGLGGLAAFVIDIPPDVNQIRVAGFSLTPIAVAVAIVMRAGPAERRSLLSGAIPVVAANTAALAWFLLGLGRERPFAGDFGLAGFWISVSAWVADAWFGVVLLRLRAVWRPAALALAVGAPMAITGMDRLRLTSEANPTVFGSIALAGIALTGFAWVLLGIEVAVARRWTYRPAIAHTGS